MSRSPPKVVSILAVRASDNALGASGGIPWSVKEDIAFFRATTLQGSTAENPVICIMGRKTYDGIPRPRSGWGKGRLPGRRVFVVSRGSPETDSYDRVFSGPEEALSQALAEDPPAIFVCGGGEIYEALIPHSDVVLMSRIFAPPGDRDVSFNPRLLRGFRERGDQMILSKEALVLRYERVHPEEEYLRIGRDLLESTVRENRTGIPARGIFGPQLEFDLSAGDFPLLTTKKVFWRGVIEELLWFLRGDTDSKKLEERGIKIWAGNSSEEFLRARGLLDRYREGDVGPVYGFQWRHWGAEYRGCDESYHGEGIDQMKEVLRLIREDPTSRRIVVSAWNPTALALMALPPCHILQQYQVNGGVVNLKVYQRSADWFLGVPFNIASYAALLHIVCILTKTRPGKLILSFGDAHLYSTHFGAMEKQLSRDPRPFPRLTVANRGQGSFEDFVADDFTVVGYEPHSTIKAPMAV